MNPSAAVQSSRLRRVLLVVLLVTGTVLGLLLAHADDTHHAVEAIASTAHGHGAEASAAWWDGEDAASTGSPESAPLEDALALCLTVASCFAALLLAVLGLRRRPAAWRALARTFTGPPVGLGRIPRLRLAERRLLCVYLI